jgi:hypothetical protein
MTSIYSSTWKMPRRSGRSPGMSGVPASRPGATAWVEEMPWAEGKHPVNRTYAWFLASWAKRLSWKEVAEVFQSSWDVVFGAVEMAVAYGREHLDLS